MNVAGAAGRIPPFNLEAERSVLGACLLEKEALCSVVEELLPEDFYDPRHRVAFELMSDMYEKGIPVDSLSFKDELTKRNLEEKTGGLPFIAALLDAVTTTANVDYHIGIVRDKSVHRNLIRVGSDITKLGFAEDKEVNEILETAEQKVFQIAHSGGSTTTIRDSKQVVQLALSDIEKRLVSGLSMTGVPTGFKDFDKMSGGLQAGSLYILAARPSMGKTAWAINVAQHVALQEDIPALVFSLEMSGEQIAQRMLSSVSRVNLRQLYLSKSIQNEQWNNLSTAAKNLSSAPIFIDDSSTLDTMELRSRCRRFFAKQKTGKGLIVLDYLQLMNSARRAENRQQEVSEISRALKGIAKEFKVPVLALSQLSRDVEKRGGSKKPQLSDLRDSGAIEQDADMVIFLYRDAYYAHEESQDSTAEVIIAKNRSGPTGRVNLVFFKEYSRFEDSIVSGYSE
ncbi:MAG: replicative DNA helicase [Synergistaceae bacterium]|nr:replicative DNA helicase [Synergistaceae bacterium]